MIHKIDRIAKTKTKQLPIHPFVIKISNLNFKRTTIKIGEVTKEEIKQRKKSTTNGIHKHRQCSRNFAIPRQMSHGQAFFDESFVVFIIPFGCMKTVSHKYIYVRKYRPNWQNSIKLTMSPSSSFTVQLD